MTIPMMKVFSKKDIHLEFATKEDSDTDLDKCDRMVAVLEKTIDATRIIAAGAGASAKRQI